jgi:bifunctional enzyme CysN/CysC
MVVETAPEIDLLENMNIVFAGHVDHGKSTVIGRLLADSNALPMGKLEQVRESCERSGIPFEYAYLIDALKDERSQSITIDSARVFFKSPRRQYTIIDAPGHIEFVKNMVSGAARAEAAVLVIDANEGVRENTRRHSYFLWMLGIRKIILAVNKMDLVNYDQAIYEQVKSEFEDFMSGFQLKEVAAVPVSGQSGQNIVSNGASMPWYSGQPLLSVLDSLERQVQVGEQPFRMPVQDVYRFTRFGDNRRIVAGRVTSGQVQIGDEVVFYPSGKRSRVKSIEAFSSPALKSAIRSQSTGFTLEEQIYVHRGELAVRADEAQPKVTRRFRVSLFWLGKTPLALHKLYFLKVGTAKVKMQIDRILKVIDASSLAEETGKNVLRHQVAECVISTQKPIAFDPAERIVETARFVIVDDYEISGGGIILEDIPDEESHVRDGVYVRDQKWIRSLITPQKRAENYNQRAAMIIITGKKGAGRKRTGNQLEIALFQSGKKVYFLGIGSVLYGVDADIKGQEGEGIQQEHIRRFAEVSHILLDAGLILVVTAIELTQNDLKVIQTVVGEDRVRTVWIGEEITTDLPVNVQLDDNDTEDAVVQIIQMMQETGIIFTP